MISHSRGITFTVSGSGAFFWLQYGFILNTVLVVLHTKGFRHLSSMTGKYWESS